MRKLIWMMSVSLDGFMDGPDHDLGWQIVDDELHWHFNHELRGMGAFLDGRVTYQTMAEFWPTADGRRRPGEHAAAFLRHDLIDEIRMYVSPVVIGEGTPMFQARDAKLSLRLAQIHTFGSGVVLLRYERG